VGCLRCLCALLGGRGESWLRVFYCLCVLFALLVCFAQWEGGELVEVFLLLCVVCAASLCALLGGRGEHGEVWNDALWH
jgi:peptidoglycan/LPS O-acetylase OafA/YrhL